SASDDSIVRQMICSSGTARYPTPRGTFTMPTKRRQGERGDWYTFEDGYGKWGARIQGSYLFHSYLFTKMEDDAVDWETYAAMGTHASHGCIRLYIEDAKWISDNCLAGTKVKMYDAKERNDYIKELLYERTFTIDSGMTYQEFASMAADATELGYASEGADVARFQTRLIELGLYAGEADGFYGVETVRAVKAIQSALGHKVTGVATESLRALMDAGDAPSSNISTLREGMSGPAVQSLQSLLASLGLYDGALDGAYNAQTCDAVMLFERTLGREETGVASGAMQQEMIDAIAKLEEMFGAGNYAVIYEDAIIESAVIDTENRLNVRADNTTSSKIIARLDPGTEVEVVDRGDRWTKIARNGGVGYVRTAYLKFVQHTQPVAKYIEAGAQPALERVSADGTILGTRVVEYGIVNTSERLLVRESPKESAKLSFMLSPRTPVRILSTSSSWAFISYGGKTGFTKASYLDSAPAVELSGVVSAGGYSVDRADETKYAYVHESDGATLYAAASESGERLADLTEGARAEVIFESGSWTQVRTENGAGYLVNDAIFIGTDSQIEDYLAELAASKVAYAVVSTGSDAHLNMRAGASSDAEVTRTLENGTIVEVKRIEGDWCEVVYDWKTGFVMNQYVLAIDESAGAYDAAAAGYDDYLLDEEAGEAEGD
ncbi:MAG: SH3 domain-containing protein, partial [Christensenellales bacterium]